MTMAEVKDFLAVVSTVGTILIAVALLWLRSQFATKGEIATRDAEHAGAMKAIMHDIDQLEARMATAEAELSHLPDKDTTHRLEVNFTELRGEMRALSETMKAIGATSSRLESFLLERSK